jgi:ABC-type phosphate transport system substrate-binding protein
VEKITACAAADSSIHVVLDEKDAAVGDEDGDAFYLRLGEPSTAPAFITRIGTEDLTVIVHPGVGVKQLKIADLQAIFDGSVSDWNAVGASGKIALWNYQEGNPLHSIFYRKGLISSAGTAVFNLAPGPAQMLTAVGTMPGSIGYLPSGWVDDTVQPVQITDLPDGALSLPVLAVGASQPSDPAARLLHCIADAEKK